MRFLVLGLALAACTKGKLTDRDYCDLRWTTAERANADQPPLQTSHAERVDACVRSVAGEHGRDVGPDGRDMFDRRLACGKHFGEEPARKVWEDAMRCEQETLRLH